MAYTWCTTAQIQKYLDAQSSIKVGTNYLEADAIVVENDAVNIIKGYLGASVTLPVDGSIPDGVKALAAMYTAALIGSARMGATMGTGLADWTDRLKNEVWASLQQLFISQNITGATALDIPLWQRLIYAKRRERAVVQNV